jgi:hypothetical protein
MQGALVTITTATKRMAGKAVGSLLSKTRKQLTGFATAISISEIVAPITAIHRPKMSQARDRGATRSLAEVPCG